MNEIVNTIRGAIKNWWISVLIGLLFLVAGIFSIIKPVEAYASLTILFEVFFLVGGVFEIIYAASNSKFDNSWGWTLVAGIIDVLIGLMLVFSPIEVSGMMLLYFVGFWIMFRSLWAVGISIDMQMIGMKGWGWLLAWAILGLIFSCIFIFSSPIFGGSFIVAFVSVALMMYGIFRIVAGIRLRKVGKAFKELTN